MGRSCNVIPLRGRLVAERAAEVHAELSAFLTQPMPICVDVAEVTALDAMGLQLLLSLRASAHDLTLQGATPALVEQLAELGYPWAKLSMER